MVSSSRSADRPLSPHLQIYRWTWTMAMSIFHRATGIALYAGTMLLVLLLVALATGPKTYAMVQWFFASPFGLFIMIGYTWALMHHMLGGIRHLVWDFATGMGPGTRMMMAKLTLAGSLLLTLLIWAAAYYFNMKA